MSEDSSQEKTEQATPKRKEDARKKGQAPRSRDLNTFVVLLVSSMGLIFLSPGIYQDFTHSFEAVYHFQHEMIFQDDFLIERLGLILSHTFLSLVPLFLLIIIVILFASMSISGGSINLSSLQPKFERLNPVKGLKRMFSVRGLVELLKSLIKFILIASCGGVLLWAQFDKLLSLGQAPIHSALSSSLYTLGWLFAAICSTLIIIVMIDLPYQIWDHLRQLKMTKQEIRDEYKETEGKPEVKSHIRRTQQEMARARMMNDVPNADVVITNPTHYSVALKYDQLSTGAPRVIAKGQDLIALQIRNIAKENNVPVIEAPPLARSIYFSTKLNHEIPRGLYVAVAQVLAYIYQLRQFKQGYGPKPNKLKSFDIPDDLAH